MGLSDKELKELARKKRNEYMQNWRKNNPDKIKKHQETYWEKVALKELEQEEKNIKKSSR